MRYFQTSLICLSVLLVSCSSPVEPPEFSGEIAYGYLVDQVAFGPRVPGLPASAACRDYFRKHFETCNLSVDSQYFTFFDPYSSVDTPLVNLVARYRGADEDDPAILLIAHYDSRPRTDHAIDTTLRDQPIDGANDGASGVAVLLELARLFSLQPPDANVDLVLVDGEDWGKPGDSDYYLIGSREFARHGVRERYRFGVVVDLIGDADQQIYREKYTEKFYKPVNDMIWSTAARLGITTFREGTRHTILDDHLTVGAAGVPTALLIDFDYPHWHTENDTPDKCSPEALANVGKVLTHIIYDRSLWPEK